MLKGDFKEELKCIKGWF